MPLWIIQAKNDQENRPHDLLPIYRELRQLTRLRADLVKMQTQMLNHIESIDHMEDVAPEVRKSYEKLLDTASPRWRASILCSDSKDFKRRTEESLANDIALYGLPSGR